MLAQTTWSLLLISVIALPAIAEDSRQATAAELVRAVFESEQWIHDVESFQARIESTWLRSQESIDHKLAQWKVQQPHVEPNLDAPQFQRESPDTFEMGFDRNRYYYRWETPARLSHWCWNGEFGAGRAVDHFRRHESFIYFDDAAEHSSSMFDTLVWPRAAPHMFWFTPKTRSQSPDPNDQVDTAQEMAKWAGDPDTDFYFVGRQPYRGVDCFVAQAHTDFTGVRRYFIGVADRLLHGYIQHMVVPADRKAQVQAIGTELAKEAGHDLPADQDFLTWVRTLPQDQQEQLKRNYFTRALEVALPGVERWCMDYQEVRPGCFFPMTQGYRSNYRIEMEFERQMKVTHVAINQPLPRELLQVRPSDGVGVYDGRYDPALIYVHRDNITPQEREAIMAEAKQRAAAKAEVQAAQRRLVGKAAPAFPVHGKWLHSELLTWENLRGRVVLVEFFAEWCGPCRDHLPGLVAIHDNSDTSGVVVIGVHTPEGDQAVVTRFAGQFGLKFPIFIDAPPPADAQTWGALFHAFKVDGIPHAVVIDRDGKVAGHGGFNEMAYKAVVLSKHQPR